MIIEKKNRLKHASHEFYYCYERCFVYIEDKVSISLKSQLSKIYLFWYGYGCIKHDKTDSIDSIVMKC